MKREKILFTFYFYSLLLYWLANNFNQSDYLGKSNEHQLFF